MYKEVYKHENPEFTICYNKDNTPHAWSVAWDGKRDQASTLYSAIWSAYEHRLIEWADVARLQAQLHKKASAIVREA